MNLDNRTARHKYTTEELVRQRPTPEQLARLSRHPIFVVLDDVRSLMNVGLVFRLCDALLVEKLYLCGITGHPPEPKIEKTAIKTIPFVPWEYQPNAHEVVANLRDQGVQIVAVEQATGSIDYLEAPYRYPLCLVFGHQRTGVSEPILEIADLVVEIPMYGIGNSLNVAMSLAVVGYHIVSRLSDRGCVLW